jgi:hypothetical protein
MGRMKDEPMRAGANPAHAAPEKAQLAPRSPEGISKSIAMATVMLEDNLMATMRLMPVCSVVANEPGRLGIDAIAVAARLLRAQSEAAGMLARVARGESRHRTIVEYDGVPDAARTAAADKPARLNSKKIPPLPPPGARHTSARPNGKANGKANGKGHGGSGQ